MESVNEYVRIWQESERLYVQPKHQMIEPIYRPPDLATLFNTTRSKFAVESFDNALGKFNYLIFQKGYRNMISR